MLSNEKIFTIIVSGIMAILAAILTHYFTMRKERFSKTYEHKLKIFTNVYTPIYGILRNEVEPGEGYRGLNPTAFIEIMDILEENIELVDPNLESILWNLKEDYYDMGEMGFDFLDEDRKLLDFILFQYNVLRKNLGLPYDASSTDLKTRIEFYFSNLKRNRNSRNARKVIKKTIKKDSKTS
ncbi:hypothetical protein [Bacillus cereus]|uniref:hypothetical protein n=1 Tax=Bacillus cereus TaxID=1396 RepID=UPI0024BC79AF|nr:hypothetical protein [Bacillus cereus]